MERSEGTTEITVSWEMNRISVNIFFKHLQPPPVQNIWQLI
jgi:hypothetical protein